MGPGFKIIVVDIPDEIRIFDQNFCAPQLVMQIHAPLLQLRRQAAIEDDDLEMQWAKVFVATPANNIVL